ncbi:hypothetical protein ACEUZ9_005312 [Paracoccus litorisediminis]|uniref:hypothetical protein n=1 Tax=Paracoccus litorisediminis TaxID=2006130 RepID=UPI0037326596
MPILKAITDGRKYAYRLVKYKFLRPQVPQFSDILQGRTAVVVGSAPSSTRPIGWDTSFRVIAINASQSAASGWLLERPDITLMQFNQIEGQNPQAIEVRRVLQGKSTGRLVIMHWRHDLPRLERGIAAFGYGYDQLSLMSRYERIALMRECTGKLNLELDAASKWSNGITGAALALKSGAERVILTGINPLSAGHAYNNLGLARLHASADLEALHLFRAKRYPVFTADPHVAEATGIALWQGQ